MRTSGNIREEVKLDSALAAASLASAAATGQYFSMAKHRRALFIFNAAAIADTKTVIAQIMQAKTALAGSAKVIASATATITCPAGGSKVTVTASTVLTTNTITINGQVFLCQDTAPDAAVGEWASGANDTAAMVNLAAAINTLLPKVRAVPASSVITLTSRVPGETVITVTAATNTLVPAFTECVGYIEIDAGDLDLANDFSFVALKLTTDATIVVSGVLARDSARFSPVQQVAAGVTS